MSHRGMALRASNEPQALSWFALINTLMALSKKDINSVSKIGSFLK